MRIAGKRKITTGWVTQVFNDKDNCVEQEFFAGDQVDWEDQDGEPIGPPGAHTYQPFDMVQPGQLNKSDKARIEEALLILECPDGIQCKEKVSAVLLMLRGLCPAKGVNDVR